jgi:glycosyltransferase involved in cell wall biosynthesis
MKIVIQIGGHLVTAPRPVKEATTLAAAGHEVIVVGAPQRPEFFTTDRRLATDGGFRYDPVLPATGLARKVERGVVALRRRFGGKDSPVRFGPGAEAALRKIQSMRADLVILHSEAGLWMGGALLRGGVPCGIDVEDWFSRDLPEHVRRLRPTNLLAQFEERLLREGVYRITTSQALSKGLAEAYNVDPPAVVRNVFPLGDEPCITTDPNGSIRLFWYSQTIGPGRGLEVAFQGLALLPPRFELHLLGELPPRYQDWFRTASACCGERVHCHPLVAPDELPSVIARHHIGLALESSENENRDLTITNKLFQYVQAGLPVIATPTAGQREAASAAPEILRVTEPTAADFAQSASRLSEEIQQYRKLARQLAINQYCWEKEQRFLLAEFHSSLERIKRRRTDSR